MSSPQDVAGEGVKPSEGDWAKLALDLDTFTQHDEDCAAHDLPSMHCWCTCGLSALSKRALEWAEALTIPNPVRGER